MTDVEAKTPNKRRISDKGEKKGPASAKKAKVTPKPQNKALNKQGNVPNNNAKLQKKNKTKSESENGSPKKLKPFVGTAKIEKPNKQQEKGNKGEQPNAEKSGKKRRNKIFTILKTKIDSDEKQAVLKQIDEKIKAIEGRDAITKTAKRRLKLLQRLQRYAAGEIGAQPQQQKVANNKAGPKKGAEATKGLKSNVNKKEAVKTQAKGIQKKAFEANKKQVKGETKQTPKTAKQQLKIVKAEESSDEDEESDDELNEDSGSDEEVEEEGVEGEEEDSDGEEDSDEDEEEDSDESEEDSPPPQVSNKKQKKK